MGKMDKYVCVCGWVYDPELGDRRGGSGQDAFPPA